MTASAESLSAGAGSGYLAGILGLIASGVAFQRPRAGAVLFGAAAAIAIFSGVGSAFGDLVA